MIYTNFAEWNGCKHTSEQMNAHTQNNWDNQHATQYPSRDAIWKTHTHTHKYIKQPTKTIK